MASEKECSTKARYHELKIHPGPFILVLHDLKKAEFRNNDRGFKEGHTLILKEYNPLMAAYTGNYIFRKVTHVQTGYGIPEGYAMLSIRPLTKEEEADHAAGGA